MYIDNWLSVIRPLPFSLGLGLLVCWFCCVTPSVQAGGYENLERPPQLQPALSKLEARIQQALDRKQIPGCAVAVVYQDKVVLMKGYGERQLGRYLPITADTVFQLGSVSKPVASTLLSILENKGHLHLEDPLDQYLPIFSKQPRKSALKIKHVLSHSTGVPRAGFNQLIESHAPYSTILQKLQSSRTRLRAGTHFDYHNAMYGTISDITRTATRLPFREALRIHLLAPLKMFNTSTTLQGLLETNNHALPHVKDRFGRLAPCETYSNGYYAVAPAGGINSSVRDMSTFLKAQLGGFPDFLSYKTLHRIHTPQVATNSVLSSATRYPALLKKGYYALGWRVTYFDHHKLVFHGGWVKGFTNFIGLIPEQKIGIVILHNSESKFSSKVGMEFFESFLNLPPPRLTQKVTVGKRLKTTRRQPLRLTKVVKKQRSGRVPNRPYKAKKMVKRIIR